MMSPSLRQSPGNQSSQVMWLHVFPSPLEWNFFDINGKALRVILGLNHELSSCFTCQVLNDLFWIRDYKAKNGARKKEQVEGARVGKDV